MLDPHGLGILLEVVQTVEHQELVDIVPGAISPCDVGLALAWVDIDAELELLLLLVPVVLGSSELRPRDLDLASAGLDLRLVILGELRIDNRLSAFLTGPLSIALQSAFSACQS